MKNIFLFLLIPFVCKSQVKIRHDYKFLSHLIASKKDISLVTNNKFSYIIPISINVQPHIENFVKTQKGTFVTINGTGLVYELNLDKDSNIEYQRIDSTKFYGHSFQSIDFSYNNTLYSFGGYGFWHHNGQLRHFDFNLNEWVVDRINKEYNTTNFLVNFQPKQSKIYYLVEPKNGETTFDNITDYQIVVFDLLKKENALLGELNSHIKLQNPKYINVPNLGGTLVLISGDYYLLNFDRNKVFRLNNSAIKDKLNGKLNDPITNTFEDGNKIYFNTVEDSTIQSIRLTQSDFSEEPYPIYDTKSYKLFILFGILLIGIAVYISKRKKYSSEKANEQIDTTDLNDFNEVERSLINQIILKANKGEYLNVEEVNTYLGIKRKSIEIQKKIRNESISRINHKFKVNYNQESNFIERIRSSNDKRVFNYTIYSENIKIYLEKK